VEPHRVVVVGKLALTCSEYLKKGRQRRRRYPPIRRFHSDPLRRFVVDTRFARHSAIEDGEKGEDQESFLAIDDRLRDSMS